MPSEKKKRVLPSPAGLDFVTPPKDSLVDDLRYALEHAKELYSDIAWDFTVAPSPTIIYAHKGIILFPLYLLRHRSELVSHCFWKTQNLVTPNLK